MKSKTLITFAAAALALTAGVTVATTTAKFAGTKSPAAVTVEGTSTLHAWTMEGSTIAGSIDLDAPESWKNAAATITIPVSSIRAGKSKMNDLMQEALKAKAHPEIRYQLLDARIVGNGEEGFVVRTSGKLTIAGVTRDLTMDVTVTRSDGQRYVLAGEAPVRMSDFGIKPPTAMLGTIRTGNDVKVTFRWTVDRVD